jgi:hypothetical protein
MLGYRTAILVIPLLRRTPQAEAVPQVSAAGSCHTDKGENRSRVFRRMDAAALSMKG